MSRRNYLQARQVLTKALTRDQLTDIVASICGTSVHFWPREQLCEVLWARWHEFAPAVEREVLKIVELSRNGVQS